MELPRPHAGLLAALAVVALIAVGCGGASGHVSASDKENGHAVTQPTKHVRSPAVSPTIAALPIASQVQATFTGSPAAEYDLTDVAMFSPTVGYAAGTGLMAAEGTTILETTDGGLHFRRLFYTPQGVAGLAVPDSSHVFILENNFTASHAVTATLQELSDGNAAPVTLWTGDGIGAGSLSFPTAEDGFIAAGTGTLQAKGDLLVTTDGGRTWSSLPDPCGWPGGGVPALGAVSFVSADEGWLLCSGQPEAGNQGKALYHTVDGGHQWSQIASTGPNWTSGSLPIGGYVSAINFTSPKVGYIGLNRLGILRTTDGGKTWSQAYRNVVPLGSDQDFSVGFLSNGFGWLLAGEGPPLSVTGDGGKTWHQFYPPPTPQNRISLVGADEVVGLNMGFPTPQVVYSTDGGSQWSAESALPFNTSSLQALSPSDFDAAGPDGVDLTSDGGANWSPIQLPSGWTAQRVGYYQPTAGWVVAHQRAGRSDIFACSATCKPLHVPFRPTFAQATGATAGIAVGRGASGTFVLYHTTDGGRHWTGRTLPPESSAGSGSPGVIGLGAAGSECWLYTSGELLLSADGGATWNEITPPSEDAVAAAAFTAAGHGLIEAESGPAGTQFWSTTDGGAQFKLVH